MSDLSALRHVDLHLHGTIHGAEIVHPNEFISEYFRVPDAYYRRAAKALNGMDPDRGDVLAVEEYGYRGNSAWVKPDFSSGYMTQEEARREIEEDRIDRASSPLEYTAELAIVAGLKVYRADARGADTARLESLSRAEEGYERDTLILQALGTIAAEIPRPTPDRPILKFVGGTWHLGSLAARLDEADIPYTANRNPSTALMLDIVHFLGWEILDHTKSLFGFGLAQRLEKQLTP